MDQATFEGLLADLQRHCRADAALPDLTAEAGKFDAPVVVLVHGIGGNARHWADPIGLNPDDTWLFDLAARPQGGRGIASSRPISRGASPRGRRCCGTPGAPP